MHVIRPTSQPAGGTVEAPISISAAFDESLDETLNTIAVAVVPRIPAGGRNLLAVLTTVGLLLIDATDPTAPQLKGQVQLAEKGSEWVGYIAAMQNVANPYVFASLDNLAWR